MQNIESIEDRSIPLINAFRSDFPTYLSYFFLDEGLVRGYALESINESLEKFPEIKTRRSKYKPYIDSMGIFRRRIMDERNIEISDNDLDRLCATYFEMINGTTRAEAQSASRLLPKLEKEILRDA